MPDDMTQQEVGAVFLELKEQLEELGFRCSPGSTGGTEIAYHCKMDSSVDKYHPGDLQSEHRITIETDVNFDKTLKPMSEHPECPECGVKIDALDDKEVDFLGVADGADIEMQILGECPKCGARLSAYGTGWEFELVRGGQSLVVEEHFGEGFTLDEEYSEETWHQVRPNRFHRHNEEVIDITFVMLQDGSMEGSIVHQVVDSGVEVREFKTEPMEVPQSRVNKEIAGLLEDEET